MLLGIYVTLLSLSLEVSLEMVVVLDIFTLIKNINYSIMLDVEIWTLEFTSTLLLFLATLTTFTISLGLLPPKDFLYYPNGVLILTNTKLTELSI